MKQLNNETVINVRQFVFDNITPYDGDESFLEGPAERTKKLLKKYQELTKAEQEKGGVLSIDTHVVSSITSHKPGYLDKDEEVIFGLQTDEPLKRAIKPYGGIKMVVKECEENGVEVDPKVVEIFTKYRKSHNDGVFAAYTEEMRKLRKAGVLTGLPDAYARGRIIGDYRRVALYGIDYLIKAKEEDKVNLIGPMTDEIIRLREEVTEQISALKEMKEMAASYGIDISRSAQNAQEAIQWTYFAYLAALKEQDGAAMSLGNVSNFFDIYIEKDLATGKITEAEAQELIDQFVLKLRMVRQLRTDEYNQLFAGDPTWLTESLGGSWENGQHKVTKTSYRFLQTLYNLGAAPEPNLTVLWSKNLPDNFKRFCAKVSIDTSSIQYENDDVMQEIGCADDYGISCCVSWLTSGKQMQFFGARCNIAKALLLAINGGKDELTGIEIIPGISPIESDELNFDEVRHNFKVSLAFLARAYTETMNVIHYMHDKYYYEKAQMALLDTNVDRVMAFGMAGLSVAADSLSAIKFAEVRVKRNDQGIATSYKVRGEFPKFGNDDDRVDEIANQIVADFNQELHKHQIYRQAKPTLSILTITSNVVYGQKTGATPDGRKAGEPFAPGANPMHGRDTSGAVASLNSVAKLKYCNAKDGISNTFTVTPTTLGKDEMERIDNLVALLNGYFGQKAHHLNVNVLSRDKLLEAMEHPELYPQLTIRVSGYAVNFTKLSRKHQQEVIARTFHNSF